MSEQIPLSVYVHLPWCARKCPYCDFNSHPVRAELPETEYVDALIRDLRFELQLPESRPVQSIFFGGGTPSLFSGAAIGRILEALSARLTFAADIEITLEANPGTADSNNFRDYRTAGVNRMSIGLQSLDDHHLRRLGRIHSADEARKAFDLARKAGFDNLNIDLMFALPQQSLDQAMQDLRAGLELQPEHLSWYHLTLEANTEFAARPPKGIPDADLAAEIHEAGCERLASAGFLHYETSAFSLPGQTAVHNRNYWQFGDYLALGAGAHSKQSLKTDDQLKIVRRARHKHPKTFMASAGTAQAIQEERIVESADLPFEFCMNALRLAEGFTVEQFETRTGLLISALAAPLRIAGDRKLLAPMDEPINKTTHIKPSDRGWRYQNRLFELFL